WAQSQTICGYGSRRRQLAIKPIWLYWATPVHSWARQAFSLAINLSFIEWFLLLHGCAGLYRDMPGRSLRDMQRGCQKARCQRPFKAVLLGVEPSGGETLLCFPVFPSKRTWRR